MRDALNSNPVVQAAVVGVLLIAVGLMVASGAFSGGSSSEPATAPSTDPGAVSATGAAVTPVPATPAPTAQAFEPGPGLPREVAAAYESGDAVVLLIVRGGGIDDRLVRPAVEALKGDPGVAVFVAKAGQIADYSRITQGVGVSQVPALVVVQPKQGDGAPEATVSYGFRGSDSVAQAVRDAVYKGRNVGYDPG